MSDKGERYQICVQGHVQMNWSEWLQSFRIQQKRNGITVLTGTVIDQSALQGLLDYLFDMGITILYLKRISMHKLSNFLNNFYSFFPFIA